MDPPHELRLFFTDRIGIEATVNGQAVLQEREQPAWVGASSRGRDGVTAGMKDVTAEGVDSGFAQHDRHGEDWAHAKVAKIAA